MIVPSSNTVAEPATTALMPIDGSVTLHVARLRVLAIRADAVSQAQFDLRPLLDSAALLADACCDLILWNGTAASWLGFERDMQLVGAIRAATGTRATTALLAMNARLALLRARRIALVTPYIAPIEACIIENYRQSGIRVTSALRADLVENTAFAKIAPHTLADMVRRVAQDDVEAVVILCTNVAGAPLVTGLTRELGIPVLDSVRVAAEHSFALLREAPGQD